VPLTDSAIRALKPRATAYKVADEKGLYLQVTPAGGRLWRVKFRVDGGVEKKLSLGAYPDVSLKATRRAGCWRTASIQRSESAETSISQGSTPRTPSLQSPGHQPLGWDGRPARRRIGRIERARPAGQKLVRDSADHPRRVARRDPALRFKTLSVRSSSDFCTPHQPASTDMNDGPGRDFARFARDSDDVRPTRSRPVDLRDGDASHGRDLSTGPLRRRMPVRDDLQEGGARSRRLLYWKRLIRLIAASSCGESCGPINSVVFGPSPRAMASAFRPLTDPTNRSDRAAGPIDGEQAQRSPA
jgi:hypothetical protein